MSTQSVVLPPVPKRPGQRLRWQSLYGSAKALAIACAAREFLGLTLVLCADTPGAHRLTT